MEPKFQTSFIPKKPIGVTQDSGINVIRNTNVFSVVATVIFVVTALTSLGLFFYKNVLTNQIKQADANIMSARAAFEPEKIQELVDINTRIISAKKLLENHTIVSRVLTLMEELTAKKMRFTEFNYADKNNDLTISISGEIQTYNALAEQQNTFLKNEFIKNPIFTNFTLGDNGYIFFNFSAKIDPSLVSYSKIIGSTP
jgi:hypothetical protein